MNPESVRLVILCTMCVMAVFSLSWCTIEGHRDVIRREIAKIEAGKCQ